MQSINPYSMEKYAVNMGGAGEDGAPEELPKTAPEELPRSVAEDAQIGVVEFAGAPIQRQETGISGGALQRFLRNLPQHNHRIVPRVPPERGSKRRNTDRMEWFQLHITFNPSSGKRRSGAGSAGRTRNSLIGRI